MHSILPFTCKNWYIITVISVSLNALYYIHFGRDALQQSTTAYCDSDVQVNKLQGNVQGFQMFNRFNMFKSVQNATNENGYHLVLVSCGNSTSRWRETLVTIKSILLLKSDRLIYLHIFSTVHTQQYLTHALNMFPAHIQERYCVRFYPPSFPGERWRFIYRECATQRLFIAETLRDVRRVLYLDIDVMVLAPQQHIWRQFDHFSSQHLASMGFRLMYNKTSENAKHDLYNSGVMLMDLENIRNENWNAEMTEIMEKQLNDEESHRVEDQSILNEYFTIHKEKVHTMSCALNFRSKYCRSQHIDGVSVEQGCLDAEESGVLIAHAAARIGQSKKTNIFSLLYDVIDTYDFKSSVFEGVLRPLLRKINALENTEFEHSPCFKSIHLFYLNWLRYLSIPPRAYHMKEPVSKRTQFDRYVNRTKDIMI